MQLTKDTDAGAVSNMRATVIALSVLLAGCTSAKRYATEQAHPSLPSPLRFLSDFPQANLTTIATPGVLVKGYVMWIPGCFFTGVAFTSLLRKRELRIDEAYEIAGSCVVPVVGGMIMKKMFKDHPEWKDLPMNNTEWRETR